MHHHLALGLPLLLAFAASASSPPRAAFSTSASSPPRAAFSTSASSPPRAAFSTSASSPPRAAFSTSASSPARAAFSTSASSPARAAFSASASSPPRAAFSTSASSPARAAFSTSASSPPRAAFSTSASSPPRAAFSTSASFPARAAFSASASSPPPVSFSAPAAVAARAARSLGGGQVHVEQRWVSAGGVDLLRGATTALLGELARCSRHGTNGITLCARGLAASAIAAAIGGRTVDLGVRQCRTVDLLDAEVWHRLEPCVDSLIAAMEELREQLAIATGRPLLEEVELQLLAYPPGGHYSKHVDDGRSTAHLPLRRSISFILYLTDDDWDVAQDGGALRVHCSRGGEPYDIPPTAGTLLLFDSMSVSHEVLRTARTRLAVVGWYLVERAP